MFEDTAISESELTPSIEEVDRAEVLIEESLKVEEITEVEQELEAAPESGDEAILETTPEAEIVELESATVVETKQVTPELSTNIEPEAVPNEVFESATSIDTAQIVSNVRTEAIANFGNSAVDKTASTNG